MFNLKNGLIMISYAAILFFFFTNAVFLLNLIFQFFEVLTPFTYGFVIAYLLNRPYSFFLNKFFLKISFKGKVLPKNFAKSFSILVSYILLIGLIVYFIYMILPQITSNSSRFATHVYDLSLVGEQNPMSKVFKMIGVNSSLEGYFLDMLTRFTGNLEEFSQKLIISAYDVITKFMIEAYYWTIGVIISIYLLFGKEKLLRQLREIKDVFIPGKISSFLVEILKLSDKKIGSFLVGNILKSILIGFLCFLGTIVLGIPYGVLISILIATTNLVPFFGPIIGGIAGTIIVLTISPLKAVWFAIFIFVLQQIDANIIGPRILGNATGLSGFWIMFSVIVGGKFFGIVGMILGAPIFSVFYIILGKYVKKKLYGKVHICKKEGTDR